MFHQLTQATYIFPSPYFYVIATLHKLDCPDCQATSAFFFRCHLQQHANHILCSGMWQKLVWFSAFSVAVDHHMMLAWAEK